MSLVMALAAGLSGALVGFVVGVAAAVIGIDGAPEPLAALVVAVAVVADLVARPRPLAVGRQVPRTWARVFPLRVAALLYGVRLGVGPFTILSTWLWWAAFVVGAAAGPWWSTAAGAAFGLGRVVLMVVVAARVEGDMAARMATVRERERIGGRAALAGAVLAVGVLLAACTGGDGDGRRRASSGDGDGDRAGASSSSTSAPPPAASPEPPVTVDANLLLAEIGSEYRRLPDDRAGLGPIDLAEAASAEEDTSAETSLLLTRGFRGGHGRAWRTQAGDEVYQAVYEFRDEPSAAAYLKDGLITLEGRGAQLYPVEAIPGATGFSQAERRTTAAVTSHGVAFVRGHRFFLLFVSSARPGSTPAQAAELGRAADARQATAAAP